MTDSSKQTDVPLFTPKSFVTDDTVLTVAVADCQLNHKDYTRTFQEYARRHPDRGYGEYFSAWAVDPEPKSYNSYGNGTAMRASPGVFLVGLVGSKFTQCYFLMTKKVTKEVFPPFGRAQAEAQRCGGQGNRAGTH